VGILKKSSKEPAVNAKLDAIIELVAGKLSVLSPSDRGKVLARLNGVFGTTPKGKRSDATGDAKVSKPPKEVSSNPPKPHNEVLKGTLVDQALRFTSSLVGKQGKEGKITWSTTVAHKYFLNAHKTVSIPLKEAKDDSEFQSLKETAINSLGGVATKEESEKFAKQFILAVSLHNSEGHFGSAAVADPSAAISTESDKAILDEVAQCLRLGNWFACLDKAEFSAQFQTEVPADIFFKKSNPPSTDTAVVPAAEQQVTAAPVAKKRKAAPPSKRKGVRARIDPAIPDGSGPGVKRKDKLPQEDEDMDTDAKPAASNMGTRAS